MTFQRNLIGLEDLLLGVGTVNQTRGTSTVPMTKINAANFPYDDDFSVQEKIDSLVSVHYVNEDDVPVYIATPRDDTDLNLVDVIWIKEISGTEWHVKYYNKLMFKFNPTTGDLILDPDLFDDAVADLTAAYEAADADITSDTATNLAAAVSTINDAIAQLYLDFDAADVAAISGLELGTASRLDAGEDPLNVVQLDADGKLPPLDGSQLTDLPVATAPVGSIVQRVFAESTAVTSYSNLIPRAGSAPANTVGTELLTAAITPKATGNKLLVRFQGSAHTSAYGVAAAALLFQGSTFKKGSYARATNGTTYPETITIETEITAPSTAEITFSVRVGPAITNGDIQFNDNSWGASGKSATLVIEEVKV